MGLMARQEDLGRDWAHLRRVWLLWRSFVESMLRAGGGAAWTRDDEGSGGGEGCRQRRECVYICEYKLCVQALMWDAAFIGCEDVMFVIIRELFTPNIWQGMANFLQPPKPAQAKLPRAAIMAPEMPYKRPLMCAPSSSHKAPTTQMEAIPSRPQLNKSICLVTTPLGSPECRSGCSSFCVTTPSLLKHSTCGLL